MRPLEHVTILDLSRVLACPFASMILAELGAKVIKVEQPNTGDETRTFEPFVARGDASESAYYLACNRSKESITVNLRSPEGQQVIRDLARTADVFIENFPVGTLKRYDSTISRSAPSTSGSSMSPAPASARPDRMRTARATTPCSRRWAGS